MGDIAHVHSACAKGKCSTQEPQLSQCHILAAADDVCVLLGPLGLAGVNAWTLPPFETVGWLHWPKPRCCNDSTTTLGLPQFLLEGWLQSDLGPWVQHRNLNKIRSLIHILLNSIKGKSYSLCHLPHIQKLIKMVQMGIAQESRTYYLIFLIPFFWFFFQKERMKRGNVN